MLDSEALTKIQSIILIAVIVVAALGGAAAYVLLGGEEEQSGEPIKIGVCADLDGIYGPAIWQGVVLAAEQVNAEGGVLGRNFTVVSQDDDTEGGGDAETPQNALTKLITVDEADFVISTWNGAIYREIAYDYKKILFTIFDPSDELTQGVLDDYDRYKYYFRGGGGNQTEATRGMTESLVVCRNHTGFNKVAFLYHLGAQQLVTSIVSALDTLNALGEYGFEVVLSERIGYDVIDFSSHFAKAEAAGAEIVYPIILGPAGIPFAKEYYDRQSPMVMWGHVDIGSTCDFWQLTDGKCEHIANNGNPVVAGYPLTTKTVPTREAYVERWGEEISSHAAAAYDTVRFILSEAIERAGTIETEAVVKALEETDVETSSARHFVFTSSHDIMVGEAGPNRPTEDYYLVCLFQWQDGVQVPVYPTEIMEEAGATYTYPPWDGPWNK